jgi:hypothetical protein
MQLQIIQNITIVLEISMKKRLEVSLEEAKEIIKNTRHLPDNERPVFLMMKIHNVTGLLYFCRTIKDPYGYYGSGTEWKKHLKENGKNVSNIWLRKFDNEDDPRLEKMARRISNELDIVESDKFANKRIESGHNKCIALPSCVYLNECFEYNAETGELFWKVRPLYHFKNAHRMNNCNSRYVGKKITTIDINGYCIVCIDGIRYRVHRIIWKLVTGNDPIKLIDHIDGNRSNNKISNLREASHQENARNTMVSKHNKLGVKCVYKKYNQYYAYILIDGERINLGSYSTVEEASLAYQKASLKHHGEFSTVIESEHQENLKNIKNIKVSKKYKSIGYYFIKKRNRYRSNIMRNGKSYHLGYFDTAEDAKETYMRVAIICEQFPNINDDDFRKMVDDITISSSELPSAKAVGLQNIKRIVFLKVI